MNSLFNPPLVNVREAFEPGQRARAAAVLVAAQARPASSLSELVGLAAFICRGDTPPEQSHRNPYELFGTEPQPSVGMVTDDPGPVAMNLLDPVHADPSAYGNARRNIPNFGDSPEDPEDDGLG